VVLQDGVLWRGQDLIPNAVEALHAFRAAGKRLLFVTNNSSKSRQEYVAKFQSLGIEVSAQEVRCVGGCTDMAAAATSVCSCGCVQATSACFAAPLPPALQKAVRRLAKSSALLRV
jgi:hypothetical protein